jgi:hypothetical protein
VRPRQRSLTVAVQKEAVQKEAVLKEAVQREAVQREALAARAGGCIWKRTCSMWRDSLRRIKTLRVGLDLVP